MEMFSTAEAAAAYEAVTLVSSYGDIMNADSNARQGLIDTLTQNLNAVGISADGEYVKAKINTIHKWHRLNGQGLRRRTARQKRYRHGNRAGV